MYVDNPFIEGDLMAETAVIAGQGHVTILDDLSTPVKEEAVSEDESESILPPDHFDDSSMEVPDLPDEVEMNYESCEDNDDEWVPDPLESNSPKRKSPRSKVPKAKPNRTFKGNRRRSTVVRCSVCRDFKCHVDEGEQLCEHLEFCTENRGDQNEDCHLICPVCRKFMTEIGNKVGFAEHMTWCDAVNQSSGAVSEEHESSLLRCKIFSCDTCGEKGKRKFMKIDEFVDHLILHIRCPFKCTRCSHRFKIGASQYNFHHYKTKHPNFLQLLPASSRSAFDGDLPTFFWWCPVSKCSEKFTTHDLRDEHLQREHSDSSNNIQSRKSFICGKCSSTFFCEDELKLHDVTIHVFMEQERVERPVENQEEQKQTPKTRRQRPGNRKVIKRKVSFSSSSSASDNLSFSEDDNDEEGAQSSITISKQSHKPISDQQSYSRIEFQKILKIVRADKQRKSNSLPTMFCPHCNEFPFKVHQLAIAYDHMETCPSSSDNDEMKKCPVCLVKTFSMETASVEYVEHVTSCKKKNSKRGDGNCLIPLQNRLFKCTTCAEDEKKWMQVDDFLEHYIYHLRYRFKCTYCSHLFVTNFSKDTHYHYKTLHPDKLGIPPNKRCTLELDLPELFWWCPVCSQKFSDDNERNIHFDQHHLPDCTDLQAKKDNYKCLWCSKAYFCPDELRYHQGTRHVYDERRRIEINALKEKPIPRKPSVRKLKANVTKPTNPKPSYTEAIYSKPSSSTGLTNLNSKPVVTLSSCEFFTKMQFRQFLKDHFKQLNKKMQFDSSKQNENRLFACNICPGKTVMDLAAFLDHYLFHKRNVFKCTKCSHKFPSNESQDTGYHYKIAHPEHYNEPAITRCEEDSVLPELIWMCLYCKEDYSSEHLRDTHVETQHPDKLSEEKSQLCQFCSRKYSNSEELLIHIGTTHVIVEKFRKDKKLLSSNYTKLQFKQILKKHFSEQNEAELSKSNSRLFLCNICPERQAMDLADFLDHYLYHRRKIFKCTKCSHRFPSNETQDTGYHYKKNHPEFWKDPLVTRCVEDAVLPELIWSCLYCKEDYLSEDLRDSHIETQHQDKLSEEKSHGCELCSKKYSSSEELFIHIGTTHVLVEKLFRDDTRYKCSECSHTFEKWGSYENHCRKMHKDKGHIEKDDDDDDAINRGNPAQAVYVVCDTCGKKVKYTYLREHLRLHENQKTKKFLCQVPGCGESFPTNEYLSLHNFKIHEIRDPGQNPLVCPYCPAGEKVLHNRAYLRKHIQAVHHKKFDVQCHMCGKGFMFQSQLTKHLGKAHQILTKGYLKCPVERCGKVFYWKGALQNHLSKHNGEPEYKCRICGKEFYYKNRLRRHELIHENAESKPYQCEVCAKRFPVRNYLYIHMKSHKRKGEVQ